jgi:hypothetical protein
MYECIDVFPVYPVLDERMVFFAVLRRPGRQRWTRAAFSNPGDAYLYGAEVARRWARMWCAVEADA